MRLDLDQWEFNVLGSVEISKGVFTLPMLTLIEVFDKENIIKSYKLVEHTKNSYPNRSSLVRLSKDSSEDYTWRTISTTEAEILGDALNSWTMDKCNSLMCYTYLYAYCRAKGVDLHEDLFIG